MVVVVGVMAVVPCAPGVISVGSGNVGWIGWVCSWSKYDFTASGPVTWCRGTWSWVRNDDVEEPRESGVLAVIFVCMVTGFCGPLGCFVDDR